MPRDPFFHYLRKPNRRRFKKLVAEHYRQVWRLALKLTGNEDDASDISQDVFLQLFLDPPQPDQVKSPSGFLSWKVVGRISRWRRSLKRQQERELEYAKRLTDSTSESQKDPEVIRELLSSLPEEDRITLELKYLAGLSTTELAKVLNISERAMRKRIEKARQKLQGKDSHLLGAGFIPTEALQPPADFVNQVLSSIEVSQMLSPTIQLSTVTSAGIAATSSTTALSSLQMGGLLMSTKKLATIVALSALIVGTTTFFLLEKDPDPNGSDSALNSSPLEGSAKKLSLSEPSSSSSKVETSKPQPSDLKIRTQDDDLTGSKPSIRGRVLDTDQNPIPNAQLWAIETQKWNAREALERLPAWANAQTVKKEGDALRAQFIQILKEAPQTESDPSGSYSFNNLKPSTYRLIVLEPQHRPHTEIDLKFTDQPLDQDLILSAGNSIRGKVVQSDGSPVRDVKINWRPVLERVTSPQEHLLSAIQRWEKGYIATESLLVSSNDKGKFEISWLEPGHYDLVISHPEYETQVNWETPANGKELQIVLNQGLEIHGRLLDPSGKNLANADLHLIPARQREVHQFFDQRVGRDPLTSVNERTGKSQADGSFSFKGVPSGIWDLEIRHHSSHQLKLPVTLEDRSLDLGELQLEPTLTLRGIVVDEKGQTLPDTRVWIPTSTRNVQAGNTISQFIPEALIEVSSDEKGQFILEGIPKGSFEIYAEHQDFIPIHGMKVKAEKTELTLTLKKGRTIRGTLRDRKTQAPIAGATVKLGFTPVKETISNEDGSFEISGIDERFSHRGELEVRTNHPNYTKGRKKLFLFTITEATKVDFQLQAQKQLNGRVVDSEGEGLSFATLHYKIKNEKGEVSYNNPLQSLMARSDEEGFFSISPPENARYYANKRSVYLVAQKSQFAPTEINISTFPPLGQDWPEVELTLTRGLAIKGRVRNEAGVAIDGAKIESVQLASNGEAQASINQLFAPSHPYSYSNHEGRFTLNDQPGEVLTLRISALGFAPKTIEVDPSSSQELDVVLNPGWSLRGQVVDQDQTPILDAEVIIIPTALAKEISAQDTYFHNKMRQHLIKGIARSRSSSSGSFEIHNIPEGTYSILARASGYKPTFVEEVSSGESEIELSLERFSAILGQVVEEGTQTPIQDFTIEVVDVNARKELYKTSRMKDPRMGSKGRLRIQDPLGRFIYDGLNSGPQELLVIADGYVYYAEDINLTVGEEKELRIQLQPGAAVTVTVVSSEDGQPLEGVLVRANNFNHKFGLRIIPKLKPTNADGQVYLNGLKEGEYHVSLGHPFGQRDPETSSKVVVEQGEHVEKTMKLLPGGRLEGKIEGLKTQSEKADSIFHRIVYEQLDGTQIERGVPSPEGQSGVREDDGTFNHNSLTPGEYRLILESQEFTTGKTTEVGPGSGFASLKPVGEKIKRVLGEVKIEAFKTTTVNFKVDPEK